MRRDAFYSAHPALSFLYFLSVMLVTAFVLHPVITGISLVCACVYTIYLKGRKSAGFLLGFVLPLIIVVAVMNPLFNHAGITVLFYLSGGNAVTLEAVLYGVNSACMFAALVLWCSCANSVLSSDKYAYLFGKIIPILSLIFSMVLRFVPRFARRIREASDAQSGVSAPFGRSPVRAVRHGLSVLSGTVTWALEGAVTTSDSMKSRGYGLKGRTSFSLFRFTKRDAVLCAVLAASFVPSVVSMAAKHVWFRYYPSIKYGSADALFFVGCSAFLILAALPLLLNLEEGIKWHALKSKI